MEPSAPCVVGSLPPVEEFTGPVFDQVHQELVASSEMTENFAEIPVVHEQVIVQDIPEVFVPLPPAQEFSAPVYGQVHQVFVGMRLERLVDARGPQRCGRTVPSVRAPLLAVQSLRALVTGCRKLRIFRSCSSSMVVDFLVVVHRSIPWSCCSADHRDSAVAPVHVVDAPGLLIVLVSLSWRLSWSRPVLDQSVSLMLDMVVDVPVAQVVQFILSLRRGCVLRSRLLLDQEIPQLLDTVIDFIVAQVVQVFPHRCAEAVPMVQTVRLTMDIPSCSTRWPMSLLCRSSWITGAVVKETVEITQLLLLRNRWLPVVLAALRGELG